MGETTFILAFVGSVYITNLVINNIGGVIYLFINLFSRMQMYASKAHTKPRIETSDVIDCLIGDKILTFDTATNNVLEKINESEFAVLISRKNMICYYPTIAEYCKDYEVSNVQFISVTVDIESLEHQGNYNIKMRSSDYSFYVVDNELNVDWIRYYFLKYMKIALSSDVKYVMSIIDDEVQFVTVNETECVVLTKDSYQVFRYRDEDEQTEPEEEQQDENDDTNDEELCDQDKKDEEQENIDEKYHNLIMNEEEFDVGLDRLIEIGEEIESEKLIELNELVNNLVNEDDYENVNCNSCHIDAYESKESNEMYKTKND